MKPLLALAILFAAPPAAAQDAQPTLEQTMLLRCSAALALAAGQQQAGDPIAATYPPLAQRGREYFVRASARLMDELHLTREQIEARVRAEAGAQQQAAAAAPDRKAHLDSVLQPCLGALDSSGL